MGNYSQSVSQLSVQFLPVTSAGKRTRKKEVRKTGALSDTTDGPTLSMLEINVFLSFQKYAESRLYIKTAVLGLEI